MSSKFLYFFNFFVCFVLILIWESIKIVDEVLL